MIEAAEKLSDGDGTYWFTMATIGWFVEQLLANQGALYLDNDNGRAGEATEALVNSEEGLAIFEWLNEMNEAGTFTNYEIGRASCRERVYRSVGAGAC